MAATGTRFLHIPRYPQTCVLVCMCFRHRGQQTIATATVLRFVSQCWRSAHLALPTFLGNTYFWPAGSSLLREVFSSCAEWGLLLVVVHRLFSSQWLLLLQSTGSRCGGSAVAAHGLTCSAALWDLHGPGSPCAPLHWEADSYQLYHQGSSLHFFLMVVQYSIIWMHQPLK